MIAENVLTKLREINMWNENHMKKKQTCYGKQNEQQQQNEKHRNSQVLGSCFVILDLHHSFIKIKMKNNWSSANKVEYSLEKTSQWLIRFEFPDHYT